MNVLAREQQAGALRYVWSGSCDKPARSPACRSKKASIVKGNSSKRKERKEHAICAIAQPEKAAQSPSGDVFDDLIPSDTSQQRDEEKFVWREQWYPAKIISSLSKKRPNSVVILNEELVIWWGEDNGWHAARDMCPHKLAPLSEGRMDNGVLECRYHAWQFNKAGQCQFSPQSAQVPQVCLAMYPIQEAHGMLWIWPQTGSDAFLKALQKKPPVSDTFEGSMVPAFSTDYSYFVAAANWNLLLENALDPTHAASLHEGRMGQRKDMVPMSMEVLDSDPYNGIRIKHNGYLTRQHADQLSGIREFVPPCTVRTHYESKSGSGVDTCLFVTPERPGSAHVFGKFLFKRAEPPPSLRKTVTTTLVAVAVKAYLAAVKVLGIDKDVPLHLFDQNTLNQDALMLHQCDRMMVDEHDKSGLKWRRFRLASQADIGIGAFWQWLDKHGGEPDWGGGVTSAFLPRHKGREHLFSHYERHTKHCRKCMQALTRIKQLSQWTNYTLAGLVAIAIVFKDTSSLRLPVFLALALLFGARTFLLAFQSRFHGIKKLPDDEFEGL